MVCKLIFILFILNLYGVIPVVFQSSSNDLLIFRPEPTPTPTPTFLPELADIDLDDDMPQGHELALTDRGKAYLNMCQFKAAGRKKWMVLFKRGRSYSLETRSLRFLRPDTKNSDYFGTSYPTTFSGSQNAIFLVRTDSELKAGSVQTAFFDPGSSKDFGFAFVPGYTKELRLNKDLYTLRIVPATDKSRGKFNALMLEGRGKKQVIYFYPFGGPGSGELRWAGDLDHDGKLDLQLMYFETNGGGSVDLLFLSSMAEHKNLVKPFAITFAREFETCG